MTTFGGAAVYLETGQGVEPQNQPPTGRYLEEGAAESSDEQKPQERG
jgi:hypothetical protein